MPPALSVAWASQMPEEIVIGRDEGSRKRGSDPSSKEDGRADANTFKRFVEWLRRLFKRGPEKAPADSNTHAGILRKAANDTSLLISHLSRQGSNHEDDLAEMLALQEKIRAGGLTGSEEQIFWQRFAKLAESAKPASIDALYIEKYADSLGWTVSFSGRHRWIKRLPFATRSAIDQHLRTLWILRVLAVIVFAMTLVLVAYLTLTESILDRNEKLTREHSLLIGGSVTGTQIESIITAFRDERQRRAALAADSGTASADTPPTNAAPANERQTGFGEDWQAQNTARDLIESRIWEIEDSVQANDDLLLRLMPDALAEGLSTNPAYTAFLPLETPIRSLQKNVNQMLSRYALPMLAAALGVFVYILRNASTQFLNLSFRASDVSNYWPRIILGVVSGLVIGWFLGQDPSGVLASISPAAVAFITGYSVEIFFNLLDSIIKALGAGNEKP